MRTDRESVPKVILKNNNEIRPLSFLPACPHYAAYGFMQNEDIAVRSGFFRQRALPLLGLVVAVAACSTGPQITRTQDLSESADTPYQKILVITLYSSFDSRRYLEEEVVKRLAERGTEAVASTSLMDTRTPVTRATFMAMVEDLDADAVLITQMASLRTTGTVVNMNPQATVNLRPTGYYNVFSVETTEYVEPQAVNFEHSLVLMTDLYSVRKREAVWGIQSKSKIVVGFDQFKDFSIIKNEADAIARYLSRDGLIAH